MNTEAHTAYRNVQEILKGHDLTPYKFHRTWRDLSMLESSLIQTKVRLYEGLSSLAVSHGLEAREAVEEELCKAFTQVLLTSIPGCARKYAAELLDK